MNGVTKVLLIFLILILLPVLLAFFVLIAPFLLIGFMFKEFIEYRIYVNEKAIIKKLKKKYRFYKITPGVSK